MSSKQTQKLIFVGCPVRATSIKSLKQHLREARLYCEYVRCRGHIPVCLHIPLCEHLDDTDPRQREIGMAANRQALLRVDEFWMFGGRISEGMHKEQTLAQETGKPVRDLTAMSVFSLWWDVWRKRLLRLVVGT